MDAPSLGTEFSQGKSDARTPGRLRVNERFISRQGEGLLTGTESAFIRLDGCNLRCWFCDTPYASWQPDGQFESLDQLLTWILTAGTQHVVLTGGEPLLPPNVVPLCQRIREEGLHLTIETAGTVDRPITCDLISISPKLQRSTPTLEQFPDHHPVMAERWISAHERRRWQPEIILSLIKRAEDFQIKFVLDNPDECTEIVGCVEILNVAPAKVWIMPQAATLEALDAQQSWIQPWCESQGWNYCDRAHLRWYGAKRGT